MGCWLAVEGFAEFRMLNFLLKTAIENELLDVDFTFFSCLFIFVLTQKRTKEVKPWIFAGQIGF